MQILQKRAGVLSRPIGCDEFPGGVRELSMLLDTSDTGSEMVAYVYWQQKCIEERMGRLVRLDNDGKFIYDVTSKVRSWVNAEVILPGAACTMTKGKKDQRESPPEWVADLKLMCEIALGNCAGASSGEGAHHDGFIKCQCCRLDTDEVVFTCCLCLRSFHRSCCGTILEACSDQLLRLPSPLGELKDLPSPFSDSLATPQCLAWLVQSANVQRQSLLARVT